jgi:Skp family chaperone for outer membrane proteins
MKKGLLFICIFSVLFFTVAAQQTKTKVLLLGCFHFDNPGLDVAKFENANILSDKRQQELKDVLGKLEQFKPDKIFVEMPVAMQDRLDSALQKYKSGQLTLNAGEIHQLGFRLAKELEISSLFAVDYNESDFPFDSLVNSAKEARQYNLLGYIKTSIDSIQNDFNESLKKNTLRELLLNQNTKAVKEFQVGAYFEFLVAGKKGNHVGSYLISEWWRRNMIIYENILKQLDGKEKSILVIFGSGHTALLHEMMKYNKNFELVPVNSIL